MSCPSYVKWKDIISHQDRAFLSLKKTPEKSASVRKRYFFHINNTEIYLTQREAQTLMLFLKGKTNKETAIILKISVRTVEHYQRVIQTKLHCKGKKSLRIVISKTAFFKNYSQAMEF